jgi:hypothetical protein
MHIENFNINILRLKFLTLRNTQLLKRGIIIIIILFSHGVRLSPLATVATVWPLYQLQMIDGGDECGALGGMRIGKGNRNTRRKPTPAPLCPP